MTLNHLVETRPDLRLRWAHPTHPGAYGDTPVSEVTAVVPARQTGQDITSQHLPASGGGLALVTWTHLPGAGGDRRLCDLITDLRLHNAAGLVLRTPGEPGVISSRVRAQADASKLPVLVTGADAEWVGVNHFIQQQRAAVAERHAERLENLLLRVPVRTDHPAAAGDMLTWLSSALDVDVALGSRERGVVTAVPADRDNGARRLVCPDAPGDAASFAHTRVIRVFDGGDSLVLGVASHRPLDRADVRLIRHAATFLGFFEQIRRDRGAASVEPRRVNTAALHVLLADPAHAHRAARTLAPALADATQARVRIIDSGRDDRERTVRWCEENLGGRALVAPSPDEPTQTVVVTPDRNDGRVGADLLALVKDRDWLVMGESRSHSVEAAGRAYAEAAQALRDALRVPGRVSTGVPPKVAPLLAYASAHAWATHLLAPVLSDPGRQQLLDTLYAGCSAKPAEASRSIGVHRNTLRQRLLRAGRMLGLDLDSGNDRILVLLALDILSTLVHTPSPPPVPSSDAAPTLDDLLAEEPERVKSWAAHTLNPLRTTQRCLTNTLCVWLEQDLSVRRTAQALGVSEATVRHHVRDALTLAGMDADRNPAPRSGRHGTNLADLGIAAYVLLGRPRLRDRAALPNRGEPTRV
nr:helix-turn-helix domain-containing protein [Streptomyces sp. SID5785]